MVIEGIRPYALYQRQEKKSFAVGGGVLEEVRRLTVCGADPTTPHQSG
eukprot:COSAG02_NODE_27959_length_599_cov_1.022000_1_plen_47_part_10